MRCVLVLFVEKTLKLISTLKRFVAHVSAQRHFVEVKSVEFVGFEDVYNLTVEDIHNYVTNEGIITKNCDTDRYVLTSPDVKLGGFGEIKVV